MEQKDSMWFPIDQVKRVSWEQICPYVHQYKSSAVSTSRSSL